MVLVDLVSALNVLLLCRYFATIVLHVYLKDILVVTQAHDVFFIFWYTCNALISIN